MLMNTLKSNHSSNHISFVSTPWPHKMIKHMATSMTEYFLCCFAHMAESEMKICLFTFKTIIQILERAIKLSITLLANRLLFVTKRKQNDN